MLDEQPPGWRVPGGGDLDGANGGPEPLPSATAASARRWTTSSAARRSTRRIALIGDSLGGYYLTRAAAFEHRLAVLVIWGAQWDYGEVWSTRGDDHPLARHLRMTLGAAMMAQARERVAAFRVGDVIDGIRCPTLVTHGERDEHVGVGHAYEALRCPKELRIFIAEEGGSAHCQWDNLRVAHHAMFGWLTETLRP